MNDFKQGMGIHSMWGLSPSFDLLSFQEQGPCCCCCVDRHSDNDSDQKQEEINILLANPGDARHIVHTLSRRNRHGRNPAITTKSTTTTTTTRTDIDTDRTQDHSSHHQQQQQHVNIFLLEPEIEILARHILQMKIFLDENIPIRHRASLYLELYNALISGRAYDYVEQAGKELGEFVYENGGDFDDDAAAAAGGGGGRRFHHDNGQIGQEELSPSSFLSRLVDLSWLKHKERDALYHVFHNEWSKSSSVGNNSSRVHARNRRNDTAANHGIIPKVSATQHDNKEEEVNNYNVELLREYRLRGYYGDRYDCRHNVSEWDYYTRVKHTAGIIHVEQWRKWRMTGVAFEFGNTTYDKENRTMITSIKGTMKSGRDRGMSKDVKGYWLDILNGPYVSHGVEVVSDQHMYARGLLEVLHQGTGAEQYRHHTVEVSMFNLIDFMWEFETGFKYEMTTEHDIFSGLSISTCYSHGTAHVQQHGEVGNELQQQHHQQQNNETCLGSCEETNPNTKDNTARLMTSHLGSTSQRKKGLKGMTVIPLLGDLDNLLSKKKKFLQRFDYVFLSQRVAHWFGSDKFKPILRSSRQSRHPENDYDIPTNSSSDCCPCPCHRNLQHRNVKNNVQVEVESGKFIFQLQEKDQIALHDRIKNMAKIQGFTEIPSSRKNTNISETSWNTSTFLFQATP